jgi:hypothetical protein
MKEEEVNPGFFRRRSGGGRGEGSVGVVRAEGAAWEEVKGVVEGRGGGKGRVGRCGERFVAVFGRGRV